MRVEGETPAVDLGDAEAWASQSSVLWAWSGPNSNAGFPSDDDVRPRPPDLVTGKVGKCQVVMDSPDLVVTGRCSVRCSAEPQEPIS